MGRETVIKTGAAQAVLDFLGCAARRHAFGLVDRGDRVADMGDCPQIARVELQGGLFDLRLKIVRKLAAQLGLDGLPRFAIRHAEEAIEHLIGRDRVAVPRQGLGMRAARNDFAVDQDTVAIENDEIDV